jgi:hypothetical protein
MMGEAALALNVEDVQAVLHERNTRTPAAEIKTMARIVLIAIARRDFDRELVSISLDEEPMAGAPPMLLKQKYPSVPCA